MRLLLTRTIEDSTALARQLEARRHQPILAPVVEIIRRTDVTVDLTGVQAILVTSRIGVTALAALTPRRDVPVFTVGDATARFAEAEGFRRIEAAGGDVLSLARLVTARLDPAAGTLLHAVGTVQAGDLAGLLQERGFVTRRVVLYEARPLPALAAPAYDALTQGRAHGVILYSPRTASLFGTLVEAAHLRDAFGTLTAYCLSPAVAEAARHFPFGRILAAPLPREPSLLDLIET